MAMNGCLKVRDLAQRPHKRVPPIGEARMRLSALSMAQNDSTSLEVH